ncbi:MAG: penicillin-binding protein activator [Gammaproteobacteria bacterium]|nr:penicillin-binding protein activator [Gammaproteobacteria bacterium]
MNTSILRPLVAMAALGAVALIAAGCAGPATEPVVTERPDYRPDPVRVQPPIREPDDPAGLLREARRAGPERAAALELRAAMLYEHQGEYDRVAEIVSALAPERLRGSDRHRFALLDARMLLDEGHPEYAWVLLSRLPDWRYISDFNREERQFAASVKARVLAANGRWLSALREYILLDDLTTGAARDANHRSAWEAALRVDQPAATAARADLAREPILRGWLELVTIARSHYPSLEAQLDAVMLWQRRWEDHPAAQDLPPGLARLPELIALRPSRVALLLPLSGPMASAGNALRDGFMAAHFAALANGNSAPGIMVFDTAGGDVTRYYMEAVDQGADVVVGPLARDAVRDLVMFQPREVPVLALNSTGGMDTGPTLIQFGLIPEDEGIQMAERAHADGLRRALILSAQEAWADRVMNSFEARFVELGGKVVERRAFSATGQITQNVAESLLISESESRASEMRRVLASNLEFEPRRRQDLDFVAMAAEPVSARALKPALAYHFAGDLPVYASSHMYDGSTDRRVTSELDGIRFIDMPWRIAPNSLRYGVEQAWPDARGNAASFYAMGADAWHLQGRLSLLAEGGAGFPGLTGTLRLGADGRLQRELSWAVLHNGLPVPLEVMAAPLARVSDPRSTASASP